MGMYTELFLDKMVLDNKFKVERKLQYVFLKLKHSYVNSDDDDLDFPFTTDEWLNNPNPVFKEIHELFHSSLDKEAASRLNVFGNNTTAFTRDTRFTILETDNEIIIDVNYDTKYSSSIWKWLEWFTPYIKNQEAFGEVCYEDDDWSNVELTLDLLKKIN